MTFYSNKNMDILKIKMDNGRDEMTKYLQSQKSTVMTTERYNDNTPMVFLKKKSKESFNDLPFVNLLGNSNFSSNGSINNENGDKMINYLNNQVPIVVSADQSPVSGANGVYNIEYFAEEIIIPPLNTDIRFSAQLPLRASETEHEISHSHPFMTVEDRALWAPSDPVRNRLLYSDKKYSPREIDYNHRHKNHPSGLHIHNEIQENFSWAVPTNYDTSLDLVKKSLIHDVTSQHACGSCWYLYLYLNNSLFFIIKRIL